MTELDGSDSVNPVNNYYSVFETTPIADIKVGRDTNKNGGESHVDIHVHANQSDSASVYCATCSLLGHHRLNLYTVHVHVFK